MAWPANHGIFSVLPALGTTPNALGVDSQIPGMVGVWSCVVLLNSPRNSWLKGTQCFSMWLSLLKSDSQTHPRIKLHVLIHWHFSSVQGRSCACRKQVDKVSCKNPEKPRSMLAFSSTPQDFSPKNSAPNLPALWFPTSTLVPQESVHVSLGEPSKGLQTWPGWICPEGYLYCIHFTRWNPKRSKGVFFRWMTPTCWFLSQELVEGSF